MPVFSRIFGADPLKTATVTQLRNSSIMHQELIALADPDSSAAVAAVVNTMPGSTAWGLVTRPLGPIGIQGNSTVFQGSSVWQVQVSNGNSSVIITSGNLTSTCVQGTNPWTIAGNSTVAPLAGSTWNTRPIQSSAADLQMTATPLAGSTWNTRTFCSSAADFKSQAWSFDGLGNAVESSTKAGSSATSTARGIVVRSAIPDCTNASGVTAAAGDNTVFSSGANTIYVYAYSIGYGSTIGGFQTCRFLSGTTNLIWQVKLGFSRNEPGTTTATPIMVIPSELAVTPPGYLFKTATSVPLSLNTTSSGVNYAVAAWRE